eukprot:555781-Hanusia_phi.AAC.1
MPPTATLQMYQHRGRGGRDPAHWCPPCADMTGGRGRCWTGRGPTYGGGMGGIGGWGSRETGRVARSEQAKWGKRGRTGEHKREE